MFAKSEIKEIKFDEINDIFLSAMYIKKIPILLKIARFLIYCIFSFIIIYLIAKMGDNPKQILFQMSLFLVSIATVPPFLYHIIKGGIKSYRLYDILVIKTKDNYYVNLLITTKNDYLNLEEYFAAHDMDINSFKKNIF